MRGEKPPPGDMDGAADVPAGVDGLELGDAVGVRDLHAAQEGLHGGFLDRLGVGAGDSVRVTSSRTTLTLPTLGDEGVPRGVAVLAFDQPGPGAADLIDATSEVTDVRLETI